MAYHRQQGVDTHIVRIFNTYGPRMRPHDGRAIPTFLRQALADKPLTVFGEGDQTRSFCYVSDLVEGFLRLIDCDRHEPVNIGNPGEFTILELAEVHPPGHRQPLGDRLRGAPPGRPDGAPARHHAWRASCSAGSRPSSSRRACA